MVRSDMYCHDCGKGFIAQFDLSLDGNHIVECPYCGHEHCRVVKNGKATSDRWDCRNPDHKADSSRCVYKADSRPQYSSTAATFIRQSWISKLDVGVK